MTRNSEITHRCLSYIHRYRYYIDSKSVWLWIKCNVLKRQSRIISYPFWSTLYYLFRTHKCFLSKYYLNTKPTHFTHVNNPFYCLRLKSTVRMKTENVGYTNYFWRRILEFSSRGTRYTCGSSNTISRQLVKYSK